MSPGLIGKGEYAGWPSYRFASKKLEPRILEAQTVGELVNAAADAWGSGDYLVYAPTMERYTFREANDRVNRIASGLQELGVEKGDRIGLFLRNSPAYVFSYLAASKLGAVEVPVNWFFKEREAQYILSNSGCKALMVEKDLFEIASRVKAKIPEMKHIIVAGEEPFEGAYTLKQIMASERSLHPEASSPEDPFAIIYTSGTTGLPKGATLSHRSYVYPAKAISLWPVSKGDADYTVLPLFHINAQIYSCLGMMAVGGRVALTDRWSPSKFWGEVAGTKATHVNLLGSMINLIFSLTEKPEGLSAKYVIIGGTPKETWRPFEEKFGMTILEGYSQTEDPLPFLNPPGIHRKIGSFGVPAFPDLGHEASIVGEDGKPLSPGETGEMIIRSPCVMLGYWNDPGRTSEAIRDGWLHSGDLVLFDKDGYAFFVDRKKFVIRKSGENIASWEVEDSLKKYPKVQDAVVIPVPDKFKGEEVKALVLPKPNTAVKPEEIIEWCAKNLAYYKVPRYLEFVEEFPYTPTGRPVKWQLRDRERQLSSHGWDRDGTIPDWKKRFLGK